MSVKTTEERTINEKSETEAPVSHEAVPDKKAVQPKRKKSKSYAGLAIFELLAILGLGCFITWQNFIEPQLDDRKTVPASTQSAQQEEPQVRTRAVIEKEESFYQLSGKKILMHDDTYGEIYMPVFEDVPACTLDLDNLITRNGYSFYKEGNEVTSIAGIDVSEHQTSIDWQQVRDAGIEFVMVRVGYRTYGGGNITLDANFRENIEGASAAGLKVGVYFFSQAANTDEAIEEADAVIDAIEPYDITYPVVFDWELIYGDSARTDTVTVEALADCCIAFCERVRSAGYTPMIYQNKNTALMKLDLPRLKDYDFWLAEYNDAPSYYYDFQIWQYASDGFIPGIEGEVDLNIAFKDYSQPDAPVQPATTQNESVPVTTAGSTTAATTTSTAAE